MFENELVMYEPERPNNSLSWLIIIILVVLLIGAGFWAISTIAVHTA